MVEDTRPSERTPAETLRLAAYWLRREWDRERPDLGDRETPFRLAVAAWLDFEAEDDAHYCPNCTVSHVPGWHRQLALAAARAYLGEA